MNILRVISITGNHLLNFIREQLMALGEAFRRPMATSIRSMRGFLIALVVGLFVAIIAVGMQPFGLDLFNHEQKTELLLGFGLVACIGMLIVKFVLPAIFPVFYDKSNWTIARQALHFLIMVLLLLSLLAAYSNAFHIVVFKPAGILKIFALSILPVIITTFIQQKVFQKKFAGCAEVINKSLKQLKPIDAKGAPPVLRLSNHFSLLPNQFIYAEISKDSAEVCWQNFLSVEKTTVQGNIEKELSAFDQFIYLDKTIIVNTSGIQKVEGNARGYSVRIARTTKEVAVPWKFHKYLEKFAQKNKPF
ncbi:hypothetical protein [Emticicia fluvialis]|uniref:hypothetical protein n=1 Tax=Emticicia fluvialis TaxID=2974474 RepID=UPI002164F6A0|nr:hypothetical protein [Emticicia fluvialis]